MKVIWIVERDHEVLIVRGRPVAFDSDAKGSKAVQRYLNRLEDQAPGPYYDAILYARPA